MPLRQLSDSEYSALAQAAGLDVPSHEMARIHHLLTLDGYTVDQLMPYEQEIAKAFDGLTLTTIPRVTEKERGLPLLAVDHPEERERSGSTSPRAQVARVIRERHRAEFPEIDHFFYHQMEQVDRVGWFKERKGLAEEPDAAWAIETDAVALYEAERAEKLERNRVATFRMQQSWDELPPEKRNPRAEAEQLAAKEKSRVKASRAWEQIDDRDRMAHRNNAEEAWFKRER